MIKHLFERLKEIWRMPDEMRRLALRNRDLAERIGDRTTVHCDVHWRSASSVIVIGEYHGKDYVRCFEVDAQSIPQLIEQLGQRERYSHVGRFDMPGIFPDVSAVYPHNRLV